MLFQVRQVKFDEPNIFKHVPEKNTSNAQYVLYLKSG